VIEVIKGCSGITAITCAARRAAKWLRVNLLFEDTFCEMAKSLNDALEKVDRLEVSLEKMSFREGFGDIVKDYKVYAEEQAKLAKFYHMSLEGLGDVMPDMVWMKWADGKYGYANKAIKDGLLFCGDPIGRDDNDIGSCAVGMFGKDSHNFGSYCTGSDDIVIDNGHRQRFIEYGMSGGKPLVLEVFKNVIREDITGKIVGTVGVGRDITDNIFTMLEMDAVGDDSALKDYFRKYLYENDTMPESLVDFYINNKDSYATGN